jgi:mono/diheme cytochrome c family protein
VTRRVCKEKLATGALGFLLVSCKNSGDSMDFERMVNQARYEYYEESELFPDRRAMRAPPEGVVPADRILASPRVVSGLEEDGTFARTIPVRLGRQAISAGRERFEVFCAPCHGVLGDGVSVVAHNMELRKPPSLVAPPVAEYPAGRIYQAIMTGYGLMPSYAEELSVSDRWSVVAYTRALGLRSAGVPMDALPDDVRRKALEELQ